MILVVPLPLWRGIGSEDFNTVRRESQLAAERQERSAYRFKRRGGPD